MFDEFDLFTIEACKRDFSLFSKLYLGQKIGAVHMDWIETIRLAEREKKDVSLIAPRGHFKTSILSVAYPLWRCFRSESPFFVTVSSAGMDQSTNIMSLIQRKIVESPRLSFLFFPEGSEKVWNKTELVTKNGHRIKCIPFGDSLRGNHPNLCIWDDILKTEESTNTSSAKSTFYNAAFAMTQANQGMHVVIGTPTSYEDLLMELATKPTFISKKYQAIDSFGNILFPEHYSLEQLEKIQATMPASSWAREYLCDPVSEGSSLFPESSVSAAVNLDVDFSSLKDQKLSFLGCDVAFSEGKKADYSAYVQVDKYPGLPLIASVVYHAKGVGSLDQRKRLNELNKIHRYARIVVEQVGLSYDFVNLLQSSEEPELRLKVEGFKTSHVKKEQILSMLELAFQNKSLKIPNDKELLLQLSRFGKKKVRGRETFEGLGAHDDLVMSLALAVFAASQDYVPVTVEIV